MTSLSADDLGTLLANVEPGEFLTKLSDDERTALFAKGRRRTVPRGGHLLVEGTRSDVVFVVLTGRVKVSSSTSHGTEVVLAVRGPGALLGELGAIDDEPRGASAIALEPIEVLAIGSSGFSEYLAGNPRVTLMLLRTVTSRLRDADRKRVEFGGFDTVSRVAFRLVELAERFGEDVPDGVRIAIPFTQDELAGWVGASREAVVKALRALRARGLVETQRRAMVIHDLPALRRRGGIP